MDTALQRRHRRYGVFMLRGILLLTLAAATAAHLVLYRRAARRLGF
jgi:hypothetical protein